MPEDDLTSQQLPQKPAASHELLEPANPASENPIAEKIAGAAGKVFEKFSIPFQRGRGRPKNCRGCGKPETRCECAPMVEETGSAPAASAVNPVHDALFSRSIASAVRGVLGWAKSLVRKKAKQAGSDSDFTEKAIAECEVEPQVMEDFNTSLAIVLEKYNAKTEYAPEIALAISAARLVVPYATLLQTFNAEIERKKALENPKK